MVIINQGAVGARNIIQLRDSLLEARNIAEQLQRQIAASTDEQITELHGIPAGDVNKYKIVMENVLTALESAPVELLLGNVGKLE